MTEFSNLRTFFEHDLQGHLPNGSMLLPDLRLVLGQAARLRSRNSRHFATLAPERRWRGVPFSLRAEQVDFAPTSPRRKWAILLPDRRLASIHIGVAAAGVGAD